MKRAIDPCFALFGLALSSFLFLASAPAEASQIRYVLDPAASEVHFDAQATLHEFGGDAKTLSGEMVWDAETERIGDGAVVRIPVMEMTTGMIKRDHSMRRMFEAEEYPQIEFEATRVTPVAGPESASGRRYRLEGILKIRRVERPLELEVIERDLADGRLEVEGDVPVSIDWFDLKPPVAFGVMRVLPDVRIHFRSVWKPAV